MSQKIRKERITKKEWYERGGFANSALFRLQSRGGAWRYYVNLDHGLVRLPPEERTLYDPVTDCLMDHQGKVLVDGRKRVRRP